MYKKFRKMHKNCWIIFWSKFFCMKCISYTNFSSNAYRRIIFWKKIRPENYSKIVMHLTKFFLYKKHFLQQIFDQKIFRPKKFSTKCKLPSPDKSPIQLITVQKFPAQVFCEILRINNPSSYKRLARNINTYIYIY